MQVQYLTQRKNFYFMTDIWRLVIIKTCFREKLKYLEMISNYSM